MAEMGSPEELRRLAAEATIALIDTPREAAFDSIVFTAAQLFRVPMAMLAIAGQDRMWLKASVGPLPLEFPFHHAFCSVALTTNEVLIVEDAANDLRFSKLPLVVDHPNIRFYAGVPLSVSRNIPAATLAVLDRQPRSVPERARLNLLQLAREAEELLQMRLPQSDKLP